MRSESGGGMEEERGREEEEGGSREEGGRLRRRREPDWSPRKRVLEMESRAVILSFGR